MVRSLFYILILLLLYFIIQFIFFPTTPNRLLAKQICIAPAGCKIEMSTGFCPLCIFEKDEPIIKEENRMDLIRDSFVLNSHTSQTNPSLSSSIPES